MSTEAKREKVRAFLAIYSDPGTAAELQRIQQMLARDLPGPGIRWTRPDQLHLTLQFLGHLAIDLIPEVERVSAGACRDIGAFQLRAEGIGCFPGKRKPRIIWAGIGGDLAPLQQLKALLDTALAAVGYVPEDREFHPHITLARVDHVKVRDVEQLSRICGCYHGVHFGQWRVEKLDLMRSVLGSGGARYHLLKSFPLKF